MELGTEDTGPPPEGLHHVFLLRRQAIEPSDAMVKTILDGGETVNAKADLSRHVPP